MIDEQLMKNIIKYFNCGNVFKYQNTYRFVVTKFDDIENQIIPFFKKYPILGEKSKDFSDFSKVTELMKKEKKHLTQEGLEKIKKIKAGMNTGRV
jgi:hypothetical protein